jgi:hypothetical protein
MYMAIQSRRRSVDGTGRLCGAAVSHGNVSTSLAFVAAKCSTTSQKVLITTATSLHLRVFACIALKIQPDSVQRSCAVCGKLKNCSYRFSLETTVDSNDSTGDKPLKLRGRSLAAKVEGARADAAQLRAKAKEDAKRALDEAARLERAAAKLDSELRARRNKQRRQDEGRVRRTLVEALALMVVHDGQSCRAVVELAVAALPDRDRAIAAEMLGLEATAPADAPVPETESN